jgi:hypothetical protein
MNGTESRKPRWSGAWRHVVAAYVLFHIAAILVGSVPAPVDATSGAAWKDPTVRDEFEAWAARLERIGVAIEPDQLQETIARVFAGWMRVVNTAMTPFRAYQELTGTIQAWSMFVAPHKYPSRLHVDVREFGDWKPVYVARSREFTWKKAQLDHIRFRSAIFRYAWPQYHRSFRQFAAWLAAEAARDFPTASHIRVRMYKCRSLSPDEVREGRTATGEFTPELTLPIGPAQ